MNKIKKWKFQFNLLVPALFLLPKLTNLLLVSSIVLLLTLPILLFNTFYSSVLQGLQLFFVFSLVNLGASLVTLMGPVGVLLGVDGLYTVFIFILLSGFLPVLMGRRVLESITHIEENEQKLVLLDKRILHVLKDRKIIVTVLSILSVAVLGNISVIYGKKFFLAETAGVYSAWMLFARVIFYVSAPVTTVSYIFFSDKEQKSEKKIYLAPITLFFILLSGLFFFFYD